MAKVASGQAVSGLCASCLQPVGWLSVAKGQNLLPAGTAEQSSCSLMYAVANCDCRSNRRLLALLNDAVNPEGSGRGLHFSYSYDLTLTCQRAANIEAANPQAFDTQVCADATYNLCWCAPSAHVSATTLRLQTGRP